MPMPIAELEAYLREAFPDAEIRVDDERCLRHRAAWLFSGIATGVRLRPLPFAPGRT